MYLLLDRIYLFSFHDFLHALTTFHFIRIQIIPEMMLIEFDTFFSIWIFFPLTCRISEQQKACIRKKNRNRKQKEYCKGSLRLKN